MIFLQGFIKLDHGISEKCVGQTFGGRKTEGRRIIIIIRIDICFLSHADLQTEILSLLPLPWKLRYQNNGVG
jgi:hypothetical protein